MDIGLMCPSCQNVFRLEIDQDKPHESGVSTVHCPKCKLHPAMILLNRYKTADMSHVKCYPTIEEATGAEEN